MNLRTWFSTVAGFKRRSICWRQLQHVRHDFRADTRRFEESEAPSERQAGNSLGQLKNLPPFVFCEANSHWQLQKTPN